MITKLSIPIVIALASAGFLIAQDKPIRTRDRDRTARAEELTRSTSEPQDLTTESLVGTAGPGGVFNPDRPKGFTTTVQNSLFGRSPQSKADRLLKTRIQTATRKLKDAADADAKADAETELRKALSEDYDARLTEYEKQLDRMEKQLAEMRKKLTRRREAKDDMVRLRMKVLEAEADELGWPSKLPGSSLPGFLRSQNGLTRWPVNHRHDGTVNSQNQSGGQ